MKYLPVLFILLLLSSCLELNSNYELPYQGDQLVVHGYLTPEGVQLHVQRTAPPTDHKRSTQVVDAVVKLYENENLIYTLTEQDTGHFETPADFIPKTQTKYRIEVSANGLETVVSAPQQLPDKVRIDTLYIQKFQPEYQPEKGIFYLQYTDPATEANFYYTSIFCYVQGEIINPLVFDNPISPFGVYNDSDHNGRSFAATKESYLEKYDVASHTNYYADSVVCTLYSLSPDLFTFCESYVSYDSTRDQPLYEQPYPIFTNLSNGFGIFGAYSYDRKTIYLEVGSRK